MKLIEIRDGNRIFYGGNQMWFEKKCNQDVGCGVIACTNTLLHMDSAMRSILHISKLNYMSLAEKMARKYFWVIPFFGINGWSLSIGMNRAMKSKGYRGCARWGCLPQNVDKNIDRMLSQGLPVTMSIGASFPYIMSGAKLTFYTKNGNKYVPSCETNAHYVSVTENTDDWYKISSWGRCYYINKKEYREFASKKSNWLFTNILIIRRNAYNI